MRHRFMLLAMTAASISWSVASIGQSETIVGIEDVAIPNGSGYLDASSNPNSPGFTSGGALFHWNYNANWGISSGFAASKKSDTTNYGNNSWQHPYNSITGGGSNSSQYAVANGPARLDLPASPVSIDITNNTYAYYSMLNGDGFAKKFGGTSTTDPDWFLLTIRGRDAAGTLLSNIVEFYLADFRSSASSQDYILDEWATVDLTGLAGATSLEFDLTSSDTGDFGMNTPAYFAADNLVLTAVPEPSTFVLVASGLAIVAFRLRHRRGQRE